MKRIIPVLFCLFLLLVACGPSVSHGEMTDSRDGKTYKTVVVGEQTWMAENLAYDLSGSFCWGDLKESCDSFGRMYSWGGAKKACPEGWHLPSLEEWVKLFRNFISVEDEGYLDEMNGKAKIAYEKLSAVGFIDSSRTLGGSKLDQLYLSSAETEEYWTGSTHEHKGKRQIYAYAIRDFGRPTFVSLSYEEGVEEVCYCRCVKDD